MAKLPPTAEPLSGGCHPEDPWPPERVPDAPPPSGTLPPPDQVLPAARYSLRGSQIEPEAAFWTLCPVPCVVRIEDLVERTDDPAHECYFPPYPNTSSVLRDELDELVELASLRDDPGAVYRSVPSPAGSDAPSARSCSCGPNPSAPWVNIESDPVLGAVRAGRLPEPAPRTSPGATRQTPPSPSSAPDGSSLATSRARRPAWPTAWPSTS